MKIKKSLTREGEVYEASEKKIMRNSSIAELVNNSEDFYSCYGDIITKEGEKIRTEGVLPKNFNGIPWLDYALFYGSHEDAGDFELIAHPKFLYFPAAELRVERNSKQQAKEDLEILTEKYF